MRGNQEAFILVKIKDGRQYVCVLNRLKEGKESNRQSTDKRPQLEAKDVIWH